MLILLLHLQCFSHIWAGNRILTCQKFRLTQNYVEWLRLVYWGSGKSSYEHTLIVKMGGIMDPILACTRVNVGNECVNEISIVKHVISEPALAIRQQH